MIWFRNSKFWRFFGCAAVVQSISVHYQLFNLRRQQVWRGSPLKLPWLHYSCSSWRSSCRLSKLLTGPSCTEGSSNMSGSSRWHLIRKDIAWYCGIERYASAWYCMVLCQAWFLSIQVVRSLLGARRHSNLPQKSTILSFLPCGSAVNPGHMESATEISVFAVFSLCFRCGIPCSSSSSTAVLEAHHRQCWSPASADSSSYPSGRPHGL